VEGLEAFTEKKFEDDKMMKGHLVIREQRIVVDGLRRAAELADRLQELQRDLEHGSSRGRSGAEGRARACTPCLEGV
jgi:hypothetical protein